MAIDILGIVIVFWSAIKEIGIMNFILFKYF